MIVSKIGNLFAVIVRELGFHPRYPGYRGYHRIPQDSTGFHRVPSIAVGPPTRLRATTSLLSYSEEESPQAEPPTVKKVQ